MGILKAVNKTSKTSGKAYNILEYVGKKAEQTEGLYCHDDWRKAYDDFKATKEYHHKEDKRQYLHDIISFGKGEISNEKAIEVAREFAEKNYKQHEVYLAVHKDKAHTHVHMVVNSVNFETGKKIIRNPKQLEQQKKNLENILEKNGLELTEENQKNGDIRTSDKDKYQVIMKKKGKSDIGLLTKSYVHNLNISKSKEEFIQNMEKDGYSTTWYDQKKDIVFTVSEEKLQGKRNAFRLSNMQKTFCLEQLGKDELVEKFRQNENTQEEKSNALEEIKQEISNDSNQILESLRQEIAKKDAQKKKQEKENKELQNKRKIEKDEELTR